MKVLILGLGLHGGGKAATTYFLDRGDEVHICDAASKKKFGPIAAELEEKGAICFFSCTDPMKQIKWADVVIKNPAIPSKAPYLAQAKKVSNDFAFLFSHPEISKIKIITVTGTKGKTTTVSAVSHVLKTLGKDVYICGNMGISAFFALQEIEKRLKEKKPLFDYLVCELSSWQIHDTRIALNAQWPKIELACLTNLLADHMNSYPTLKAYHEDKIALFGTHCKYMLLSSSLKDAGTKDINASKSKVRFTPSNANPYLKEHHELALAYDILRTLKISKSKIVEGFKTFKGMPHRKELLAILDDLMFVNDSAATIGEAVTFTSKTYEPLLTHLICGGTDKELKADGMIEALCYAKSITLLNGTFTNNKLIPLLQELNISYDGPFNTMKEAFDSALDKAVYARDDIGGMQVILLSPGAASFELFSNEFDRGNQFKRCVTELVNSCGENT